MDYIMLEELRKCAEAIMIYVKEKGMESEEINKKREFIKGVKNTSLELSRIATEHGILELKPAADKLSDDGAEKHLKEMLYLIVDGVDPVLIEEILQNTYFVNCYSGFGGLEYLIYMNACLGIQEGMPTRVIEAIIDSVIPDVIRR